MNAPSFLTGQASSPALAGVYMLAHALAANRNHKVAFAAYACDTREFAAMRQTQVDNGGATFFSTTAWVLVRPDAMPTAATATPTNSPTSRSPAQAGPVQQSRPVAHSEN